MTLDPPADLATPSGKWKAYPAYRDSGVEWLGEVPDGWETWKLSHAFGHIGSGTTPSSERHEYYGGDTPWVLTTELRDGPVTTTQKAVTSQALRDFPALNVYAPGTLLIAMYGATIGKLGLLATNACTNQACCALADAAHLGAKFAFYALLAQRPVILSLGYGGGQPNISQETVRALRVPAPPPQEQRAIADFLDRETGKIDALLAKKERLIELLQEKRAALIGHAVTKGLDPTVPMKDSGVEWLGDVPELWGTARLKSVARLNSGEAITSDSIHEEGEYAVYGGNGLRGYTSSYTHDGHYVLIGRQGALCGNINYAHGRFWASEHAVVVHVRGACEVLWLGELLRTMDLNQYSVSAAQPGLSVERIEALGIPVPPSDEQRAIANHLDRETGKLEALIGKVREATERLNEYRTALISAAVTGKIDVRESGA